MTHSLISLSTAINIMYLESPKIFKIHKTEHLRNKCPPQVPGCIVQTLFLAISPICKYIDIEEPLLSVTLSLAQLEKDYFCISCTAKLPLTLRWRPYLPVGLQTHDIYCFILPKTRGWSEITKMLANQHSASKYHNRNVR